MSTDLARRVQAAVERGSQARSRFYRSIELEDEQTLGPPASLRDVEMLEKLCARPLPPSYQAFLSLHDGWTMVDGGCDLLSASEMTSGPVAAKVRKWQASMAKEGLTALATGLVIGISSISQKRIVLDLGRSGESGECPLIQWDSDEYSEYDSFVDWLENTAREFEELVEGPEEPADGE